MVRVCFPSTLHREIPSKCDGCTWDINQSDMPYSLWQINFALFPKKFGTSAHLSIGKVPLEMGLRVALYKASQGEGGGRCARHLLPLHPAFHVGLKLHWEGSQDIQISSRLRQWGMYPTKWWKIWGSNLIVGGKRTERATIAWTGAPTPFSAWEIIFT